MSEGDISEAAGRVVYSKATSIGELPDQRSATSAHNSDVRIYCMTRHDDPNHIPNLTLPIIFPQRA